MGQVAAAAELRKHICYGNRSGSKSLKPKTTTTTTRTPTSGRRPRRGFPYRAEGWGRAANARETPLPK